MTDQTWISGAARSSGTMRGLFVVIAAVIAVLAAFLPFSPPAQAESRLDSDYRSYFQGSSIADAGWTSCPAPITYSLDVRALSKAQRKREIRRVTWSMRQWAKASGLTIRFVGRERLRLDPASHTLHPADGSAQRDRHVYISFLREGRDPLMVDPVAGLAMPARVSVADQQVIGGVALFRARHVRTLSKVDGQAMKGLYLHELGHVFGLGHADHPENVMHPLVVRRTELGPGDVAGVAAVVKPCPTQR
jgi:hypothetical protein